MYDPLGLLLRTREELVERALEIAEFGDEQLGKTYAFYLKARCGCIDHRGYGWQAERTPTRWDPTYMLEARPPQCFSISTSGSSVGR